MRKGVSFYFGFDIEPEKRAAMIANSGLNTIMTTADPIRDDSNGTIETQMALFHKNGLGVSSLHSRYKSSELPEFFKEGEIGDRMEQNYTNDVLIAAKYGFSCVVLHLFGDFNEIGTRRIDNILKVCEQCNVPLAIENIDNPETFMKTMEHYKDNPYIKMCYDCGHNHIVDPEFDYVQKFADKIICLHLHDNMGKTPKGETSTFFDDLHTLNKYGNIDWDNMAKKLALIPNDVSLDYELLFYKKCPETPEEVLEETYKQACELEEKIAFYKEKNKNN